MTTKYLKQVSGVLTEVVTVSTSGGSGDADKIPSLGAAGILALSIVNGTVASAGSGDSGKLSALDSSGKLDTSVMPVGIGADTASIVTTENLAAGDYVNIFNSTGAKARRADASNGRQAHGFVLAGVTSPAAATVYFAGQNTQVSSKTPGATQYLSDATPGATTETAPTTAAHLLQVVGVAISATAINTDVLGQPITLA